MGDRVETEESDEELAAIQMGERHEECDKGWFEDFDESKIIEMPRGESRVASAAGGACRVRRKGEGPTGLQTSYARACNAKPHAGVAVRVGRGEI